ncbi:MAG: hypothetical protein JNN32_11390 [Flavobacteriales bacterium]|nr:hypothetical protein [Flavobacteriales bacterium]
MSTERTVRTILCVLGWVMHSLAAGQDPFHRSFTMEDGLPSNKVYRAIQDHEGFMWFATDNGVARFDGLEFTVLGLEDGLVDNEVIMIQEDTEHRIWFMGLNGRLAYWKDDKVFNERNDPRLKGILATAGWSTMAVDKDGAIWFGALSGELVRFDMVRGEHRYVGNSIMKRNIGQDAQGSIISISGGVFMLHAGDSTAILHHDQTNLHSTHLYPSGQPGADPLVMLRGRLHEVSASGILPLPNGPELDPLVHRSAMRTAQGDIWLHRHDRGVDLVEATEGGYGPLKHFFNDRTINMVFTDRSGHHWICTASRGVVLLTKEQLDRTRWLTGHDVSEGLMTSMEKSGDRVWIGTDQGRILIYDNGVLLPFEKVRSDVPTGRVLRILSDPDGTTWFGTDYTLYRWKPSRPDRLDHFAGYTIASKPPSWTAVKALLRTSTGELLTGGIGLHRVETRAGVNALYTWLDDSYLRFRIRCLGEDQKGVIWAGVHHGLLEVNDHRAVVHMIPDSVLSSEVIDMVVIGRDSLLLATNGNGLILWSSERVLGRIGLKEGLPSMNIRRMRAYGDTIWCATPSGVVALVFEHGSVVQSWTWSVDQGLPTNDLFDMVVCNGKLLMISDEGLGVCALEPEEGSDLLGPLHVARFQVNDRSLGGPRSTPALLRRGDRVRIDVHALEFVRAHAVEYAYSLDQSKVWHSCTNGQVVLDGPSDGVHKVAIRARLPNGPWTAPITLEFEVRPPWWARRWVLIAGGSIIILGIIFTLWRFERTRYRKRLAMVTAQMALNEERRRIAADVHDDLGADLSRLLLQVRRNDIVPDDHERRLSEGVIAAINKIDEIIWSLDPKRDTLRGTLNFIERYALELCESNGLAFRTTAELPDTEIPLTAYERREVFLIVKEAMRNVVKHAAASTMSLHAALNGEVLIISISDDGKGIRSDGIPGGRNGMRNMHERASRLGGLVLLQPIRPTGTSIELHFPPKNRPNG